MSHFAPYISASKKWGLAYRWHRVFPFAVVFEGLGSRSRAWSLLALFGLANFTSFGCVKEVNLMPDAGADTTTGTAEKGPAEDPGQTGTSTQNSGSTAPDPGTPTGSDSAGTASATGGSTSDSGASSTETQEEDTGDPNAACVSDDQDRQCVPKAPVGWYGPVGLLQASEVKDTQVCKAHSEIIDELFDGLDAPAIECTGCAPVLEYPESLRVHAVEYKESTCGESAEVKRWPMGNYYCHRLEPDGDADAAHWKMLLPKAEGELTCVGGEESSNKKPATVKNYFRGCQVERKGKCESEEDVCAKKGVGPTCVYREGEAECPSAYSAKRQVLFGGFEDTRACSACEGVMKKQGSWSIQGKIRFFNLANCFWESKKRVFDLSDMKDRCMAESARKEKGWNAVRLELTPPKFDGVCEAKGWEPQGEVKTQKPVTVCCRGIEGEL